MLFDTEVAANIGQNLLLQTIIKINFYLSLSKISGNITARGKGQKIRANSEFEFLSLTNSEIGYFCRNHKSICQYSVNNLWGWECRGNM